MGRRQIILTLAIDADGLTVSDYAAAQFGGDDLEQVYVKAIGELSARGADAGLSAIRAANAQLLLHPGGGDEGAGAYNDRLDEARSAFREMRAAADAMATEDLALAAVTPRGRG